MMGIQKERCCWILVHISKLLCISCRSIHNTCNTDWMNKVLPMNRFLERDSHFFPRFLQGTCTISAAAILHLIVTPIVILDQAEYRHNTALSCCCSTDLSDVDHFLYCSRFD